MAHHEDTCIQCGVLAVLLKHAKATGGCLDINEVSNALALSLGYLLEIVDDNERVNFMTEFMKKSLSTAVEIKKLGANIFSYVDQTKFH